MKKLFITLIVCVLYLLGVNAQNMANYHFSTSRTAVLEDMSGSTQLIPGSARNLASSVTPIGFTFKFMASDYTQFSVNSNGQFCFGGIAIPGTGISNPIAGMPLLVPISGSDSILGSGKVHYALKGTLPNRILVVEWKDIVIPFPIVDNNPPIAEFNVTQIQVILHETSGLIEFKYGVVNNNSVPEILKSIFISSDNTATTVKSIGSNLISAADGVPVNTFQMNSVNTDSLNGRLYSFDPIPYAPTVTVVDSCNATSSLTASNYIGTLLWSTLETTPKIVVSIGGVYTVTQTVDGYTSLPGSGTATPVPTITGPMIGGLPATLDGNPIAGQVYTTETGMTNYVWAVSAGGTIFSGQGTPTLTVDWGTLASQQTISVSYTNALGCTVQSVMIINYYPFAGPIDPLTIPQFVDPVPHFAAGLRVNAKAGGPLVIKEELTQQIALPKGTILATGDTIGSLRTPNAGKGNYAGYAISKDGGSTWGPTMWPAQTIECQQGNGVTVEYRNKLNGVRYSAFNILADQTLMMNGYDLNGDPLTTPYNGDIPMVVHLHGGEIPSGSDGGPTAWFMPDYAKFGPGFLHSAQSLVTYPNKQEAATLWYHPHDQGLTRINVYTGLAGYYFLRGTAEEAAHLPGWSGDTKVQEVTPTGKNPTFNGAAEYLPEIELAVQDRMFNIKGELYWPVAPTNPDIHPFWTPEFFGDIMTVNGKSWPYLSVAPRKYRFRLLDGCNARFLNMWLKNLDTGANGPKITVIGTDGGLLDTPVELDPATGKTVFMAPGERMDVVIDFTGVAPNTVFTLMNDANAPYPTGDPVVAGLTDRIMQFVVNGNLVGADNSALPANLRPSNPMVKLTDFNGNLSTGVTPTTKRQIILNEVTGPGGPVQVLFNNSHFDAVTPIPGAPHEFGGPTEMPLEGTTEMIQIINTTVDAHPIHIHLLQWQLVSRQAFNTAGYMTAYTNAWAAHVPSYPIWPAGLGYPGGAGSPFPYLTPNADGAVGGNPAVTPFLDPAGILPLRPEEMGWKDDIKSFPGEVATFIVRVAPTDKAINSTPDQLLMPFDPSIGPGYVWHCHIIDHEDMDMMRPLVIKPSALRYPQITGQPQPVVSCINNSEVFSVAATSDTQITYQWQVSTDNGVNWTDLANVAPYSGALTATLTVNPIALNLSTKMYRVILTNIDGVTTSNAALLTVDPDVPASVSITANENTVFAGETIIFTPTPVGGGTAPTYEWFVNGLTAGTGSTYTYAPANGDVVYAKMTSSAHCATGSPATSNSITMVVNGSSSVTSSGDWNTPATWANNTVPTISDNVVIPIGKTVTISTANAFCKNLVVEGTLSSLGGTHTLTVAADLYLENTLTTGTNSVLLKGATSGSGNIDAAFGTVIYGGVAAQVISNIANNALDNLTIDNKVGVTLPALLNVMTTLTINAGAKLTNPEAAVLTVNNVMIKSDLANGTGTFVDNGTTNTTVGGVANVQQYLTGGRNWYISSPVTTATTSSISSASMVQSYDESSSLWVPESSALNVLKGYVASISTSGAITFTGAALNTGAKNPLLTRNGSTIKTGYNLVGNPYPSYLNWAQVYTSSTNLEATMWYRTKNFSNTAYVFDTYNAASGIGTSNNGTLITSQIPPMQAFWVRVASGVQGTISLNNAMRTHEGVTPNRLKAPSMAELTQQVLRLQVSNGINKDEAIVLFNSNASDGFDAYDSEKMTNNNASVPEIYTLAGTEPLVINGLNSLRPNQELSLGFTSGELNMFTIKATEISNFDADTKVVLKDKMLNKEKELTVGTDYSFTSDAVNTSTRFSIQFKSNAFTTGIAPNYSAGSESMFIYRNQNNQITVNRTDAIGEGTITVCNAIGQKLISTSTTGNVTVVKQRLLPGVYLVTVDVHGNSTTKKITLY